MSRLCGRAVRRGPSLVAWKPRRYIQEALSQNGGSVRRLPVLHAHESWRPRRQERLEHPLRFDALSTHWPWNLAILPSHLYDPRHGFHLVLLLDGWHLPRLAHVHRNILQAAPFFRSGSEQIAITTVSQQSIQKATCGRPIVLRPGYVLFGVRQANLSRLQIQMTKKRSTKRFGSNKRPSEKPLNGL